MKKPPTQQHTNTYWLSPDGQQVNGPYSMPQIQAMHKMTPLAPTTPMRLEGTDDWATVADWLPMEPKLSQRQRQNRSKTNGSGQTIPSWVLLTGLGLAVVVVVLYFFVL
jgi:hypothetical protein